MARDGRLTKYESVPVVDSAGRLLGSCTVRKFLRRAGKAYNEITLRDTEERILARIRGYRLHSRVSCGEHEANTKRIDSKDALTVARLALEHGPDGRHVLQAIQEMAELLAEERGSNRQRGRGS